MTRCFSGLEDAVDGFIILVCQSLLRALDVSPALIVLS